MDRQLAITRAVAAVRNAFIEKNGLTPDRALTMARVLLSRPGVSIGQGGRISWQGQRYDPTAFTQSKLAQFVTGQQASDLNQKAIQGDPGYIQALAQLGLNRDQANAVIDQQRREQEIQFGDPGLVQGDPNVAGAAGVNPFSTVRLLQLAYQNAQQQTQQAANRYGTLYGGGYQSGMNEAGRINAGQAQDAYTKYQSLLSSLGQNQALNNQTYQQGQSQAGLDAYNRLLASGIIHAATPPNLQQGRFRVRPRTGSGYHAPPPPPRVGTGGGPIPPPVGGPIPQPTAGQPPQRPGGPPPPPIGLPSFAPDYATLLSKYGVNGGI